MVIDVYEFLNIVLYISLILLIIIFTVLGIKLIKTLKGVDAIISDVNSKMNKVDGVFNIIDKTTDYASSISDKLLSAISSLIGFVTRKKKGNDDDE